MVMRVWHLSLFLTMSSCCMEAGRAVACNAADLAALRSFAASFGPAANFSDWETSHDCCAWPGVACSSNQMNIMRVTNLSLDTLNERINQNGGIGHRIPVSVCGLSQLIVLRLISEPNDYNVEGGALWGSIPECIASNLTNLVELDLSFNSLTGSIPALSSLPHLQSLRLSSNSFSGPFPSSHLLFPPSLSTLDLSVNSFSGPFPSSLLFLPNLTTLDLSVNNFSGPLPSHFNCPLLQFLSLTINSFSDSIPSFNAPLLTTLDLSSNALSGNLSSLFGPLSTLPSLSDLLLQFNALSGQIPTFDPSRFPSLTSLFLDGNLLNGSLPHSLCGLHNLQELSMSSNAFSGQFLQCKQPDQLNNLLWIEASSNYFSGPFPEWLGSLSKLQGIELSDNSFNGSLPHSWQNISQQLVELWLSGSSLVPESLGAPRLPNWVFASTSIQSLVLSSMNLQATDLSCSSLHNNTSIQILDLSQNNLTSDVLRCLNPSTQFETLNLSGNPLSFSLDHAEMVKLLPESVTFALDMSSCELRGHLSHHFLDHITSTPSRVDSLLLAHNYLVGRVPAHLGNLSASLQLLDLSHNHFTGFDPLLHKFTYLTTLLVSNNNLEGSFSSLFYNIFNITGACEDPIGPFNLDLSHNFLSGVLPPFLGPCFSSYAERVKLNDNLLEGFIPNHFLQIKSSTGRFIHVLKTLSLSNNQLSGPIPSSFKVFKRLQLLDLSHNMLNGNLQDRDALFTNASFTDLRVLLLGYNDFTGSIPISLGDIAPALQVIDFSNNHLIGTIPVHALQALPAFRIISTPYISGLTVQGTLYEEVRINVKGSQQGYAYVLETLTSLDLSGNNLSGPISTGLGELAGLVYLNLSRNNLSGLIASDLGKLSRQLQSLDLSFNVLEGPIPLSFHDLTNLEVFNVSYNKGLNGTIPLNQPQFEMAESYIGDPDLCGEPTLHSCSITPHNESLQFPMPHQENSSKFARWIDEWISIPGLSLGIVAGFFGVLWILVFKDFFS